MQELKRELEQREKELTSKENQTKEYNRLAQQLDLPPYTDSTTFYAARTQGEELKQDIDAALQTLEAQRDEKIALRSDLQKQQTKLEDELKSLRSRKSQIPKTNLDIRDRFAHNLNLADTCLLWESFCKFALRRRNGKGRSSACSEGLACVFWFLMLIIKRSMPMLIRLI